MGYKKAKFTHDDALAKMPWDEFERLMARHYAARGYRIEHSGTGSGRGSRRFDGGIDLKLFRDGEYIVVQCKRENFYEVTHNVVHQLIGVMHTQHATRAIVVITGEFSAAAVTAAAAFPQVELIDGVALRRMLAATGDLPTAAATDDVLSSMAGGRSPNPSWARKKNRTALFLVKAMLPIALFLFGIYVVIPAVFQNMATSMVHATKATPVVRPAPPVSEAIVRAPEYLNPAANSSASGATVTPPSAFRKLSKKEAEEWDKKNAESMRILEKTTPSLQ